MNIPDPPWTRYEKVELLAEIIKASNIPPEALVATIKSYQIQPQWYDQPLPRGRTVNQSQAAYTSLLQSGPTGPLTSMSRSASVRNLPRPLEIGSVKRSLPSEGSTSAPTTGTRYPEIQPKPPSSASLGSILNPSSSEEPSAKRKRGPGRPTKAEAAARREAEVAARSALARSRGEPPLQIPPPLIQRRSTGLSGSHSAGPSTSAGPSGPMSARLSGSSSAGPSGPMSSGPATGRPLPNITAAPVAQPRATTTPPPPAAPKSAGNSESSSGRKRRGRPPRPKTEDEALDPQPAGGAAVAATAAEYSTPSRQYPDILTRDSEAGAGFQSYRAPRGGDP